MTYNKPKICKVDGAINAIQYVDDKVHQKTLDGYPWDPLYPSLTESPAYQADE